MEILRNEHNDAKCVKTIEPTAVSYIFHYLCINGYISPYLYTHDNILPYLCMRNYIHPSLCIYGYIFTYLCICGTSLPTSVSIVYLIPHFGIHDLYWNTLMAIISHIPGKMYRFRKLSCQTYNSNI